MGSGSFILQNRFRINLKISVELVQGSVWVRNPVNRFSNIFSGFRIGFNCTCLYLLTSFSDLGSGSLTTKVAVRSGLEFRFGFSSRPCFYNKILFYIRVYMYIIRYKYRQSIKINRRVTEPFLENKSLFLITVKIIYGKSSNIA